MTFLIIITIFVFFILYKRYFPTFGVRSIPLKDVDLNTKVVDVRDYNVSYKAPVSHSINLPIAYLKRNYQEIPKGNVHVLASNSIERNMAIRFLRKKGYRVIGYSFYDKGMIHSEKCNFLHECLE